MMCSVCDLLMHRDESRASRIAIVAGERRITYAELARLAGRYARLLNDAGVRRAGHIALFLPRSIELVAALFAAWSVGAVAVLVNDVLKNRQVRYIIDHAEASLLLTTTRLLSSLSDPGIERQRIVLVDRAGIPDEPLIPDRLSISSDLALIIYTSGSTGKPKGIMLSHGALLSGTFIVSDYLHLTESDIIISVLPFSFDYGLNQLFTALHVGGRLVIQRSVLSADICNTLVRERVSGMGGVPMLWQQLAGERSPFIKTEFPDLRYITNSGGRMPENVTRLFRRVHPHVQIYLMYGLTEAFRSTYLTPDQVDTRPASIGKAIPNVEILVLNAAGKECGTGEVGELVHRGANIAMGYWRDPGATAQRFKPAPVEQGTGGVPEIAVYSGDYVRRDEEGYLYFVGRKDHMIKSHGMRVSPEEIEECVLSSQLVDHAVAFSVPSQGVEDVIVAAVVPHDPANFHQETLARYLRRELPEYMRPGMVWELGSLPQTPSGKPDRVMIREMFLRSRGGQKE